MHGLGSLASKITLRRAYDLDNRIYTEEHDRAHSYSLIEMHSVEAAANKGKFVELLEFYKLYDVGKELHMSFREFIELPADMIEMIKTTCSRWRIEENTATETAIKKSGIDVDPK